jgi:DNA modification methylase
MASPTVTLLHGDTVKLLTAETGLRSPLDTSAPCRGVTNSGKGGILRADASITDPPYNVSLDGDRDWDDFQTDRFADTDREFMKWVTTWARPIMVDVLWPGALMASFSAHRTAHGMMFGMQDAGFSLIDVAIWLYATGQVKHKQKLKPAYEPITIGRAKSPQGGDLAQLNKLFKDKGRGMFHTQEIKAEEGRHPINVDIADPEVLSDSDIQDMSKFLYVAKPSRSERDYGCEDLAVRKIEGGLAGNMGKSSVEARNIHPTVKPIELMRRLVRMLTKPGATVIDPFMGSGTTGIACVLEGRNFIGIEREEDFFEIARHRIAFALREGGHTDGADTLMIGAKGLSLSVQ